MNADLARGGVWSAETWADMNKVVAQEAARVRVVQKVFPTTPVPGARNVSADEVTCDPTGIVEIKEGTPRSLVEMQGRFRLTQTQVESDSKDQAGLRLARLVAKALALAEDLVLLRGGSIPDKSSIRISDSKLHSPMIQVLNTDSVQQGLLQEAADSLKMDSTAHPNEFTELIFDRIARLTSFGEPGPFALLIAHDQYSKLYKVPPSSSVTYEHMLKQAITGGLYPTGAFRGSEGKGPFGLLASLSGGPVSIYLGSEPRVTFIQSDPNGVLQFRVSERVQYVVRSSQALVRLEFE